MKKLKKHLALILASMLILTGCGKNSSTEDNNADIGTSNTNNSSSDSEITSTVINEADMFSDRDFKVNYDESKCVKIQLNGTSASCDSDAVNISGTTITLSEEATYLVS